MTAVQVAYQLQAEVERAFSGFKGAYRFQRGVFHSTVDAGKVEKLTRVMRTFYGAEPIDGTGKVPETAAPSGAGPEVQVPSGVRPVGSGPAKGAAPVSGQSAGDTTGPAGSLSGGDGHQHSGDDGAAEFSGRLRKAVESLDAENDEHWTADGRPRVDAVEKAYGKAGVTRADVERVAPGLTRSA